MNPVAASDSSRLQLDIHLHLVMLPTDFSTLNKYLLHVYI